jgi:hypothetical protein
MKDDPFMMLDELFDVQADVEIVGEIEDTTNCYLVNQTSRSMVVRVSTGRGDQTEI